MQAMPLSRALLFGMSRHHGRTQVEGWADLIPRALAAGLGSPVTASLAEDYQQLLGQVLSGAVDVAWLPPLLHARAAEQGARLVALPQRGGWLTFRSALLVRKDDPVKSLADLRAARAAWRDRASASGYLFPRLELAARGATFAKEKFYGSLEEAAHAVVEGEADLCTCFVSDAARDRERAAAEIERALGKLSASLRVLHVTEPIPPDGFVVAAKVSDEERAAITTALLGMHDTPEGRKALEVILQADRLAPVNDALLRSLRSWAAAAAARAG
jgi:phosphate/phosphite/phosphonate ABC transporter binding protein